MVEYPRQKGSHIDSHNLGYVPSLAGIKLKTKLYLFDLSVK